MSSFDANVMDDLFYDAAEGPAHAYDAYDDGDDEFTRIVSGAIGGNAYDEADDWADAYDAYDDFDSDGLDAMEEAVADALEAEDTDEFFRRLARGIGRVARGVAQGVRRIAPVVGRIARVVAPIASAIPLPWTQAIGAAANIAGRLMADGADEFDALEEMFDFAEDNIDAAAPVIAGLTIRRNMPNVARLPRAARVQLVRSVTRATRTVARRQGPQAARAIPAVVRTVQTAVRQQRVPARAVPQVIQRAAARVSRSPATVRRMAAQAPAAARPAARARIPTARRSGVVGINRQYTLQGPVTISIQGR